MEWILPQHVHAKILHQILKHSSFWNSPNQLLVLALSVIVDCSLHKFNILRCSACCRPSRTWITFNRFSTIFEVFVPHFYLCCTHYIIPERLLNHPNSFHGGMSKLNAKFGADLLLDSLSHFECDGHTVHMLTQWCLLPPLTSTVKSSLLTHAHSSPLSLAAWLHPCHANRSHYINWLAFFWTDLVFEMFVLSLHLKDNLEGIKFFSPTLFFSVLL